MTIPLKQLPKMHKVCDKCYQDTITSSKANTQDAKINKLVFKRDSEKCSANGCNKRLYYSIIEKTKKVSIFFNLSIQTKYEFILFEITVI